MKPLISALLLIAGAAGQTAKVPPPPPAEPKPFQFPKTESKTLPNGLTVIVAEDHRQPVVSYRLVIPAGSSVHDATKAGLANLTAELLRNGGTKTHTTQDLSRIIDAAGGSLSASASDDNATITGTWMKSRAELGFQLLADTVLHPVFDEKDFARVLQQSLAGMQVQYGNPEFLVGRALPRLIYGAHPYGYPTAGTRDTLRALKRDDLVAFHKERYIPAGAYLAVAGDVTAAETYALATKYLGEWKGVAPAARTFAAPPAPARQIVVIDKADAVQTQIMIGELEVPRNHPDYLAIALANHVFGGTHTSRLSQKMRATEGLTYTARSNVQAQRQAGTLTTYTFTRTEKTGEAVKTVLELEKEFLANPVTEREVEDAKAFQSGIFQLSIETAEAVANTALVAAINGLPADYWQTFVTRIRAVTTEQVAAAAKKYLHPDRTTVVVAGNAAAFVKDLEALGKVRTIKVADFDEMSPDLVRPRETVPAATAESRAKGKALLDAAVKASGGADALRAVKDLSSKGTLAVKAMNLKAEFTEAIVYPNQYHTAMKMPFGEIAQGYDGKVVWMRQGPQPVRELPASMIPQIATSIAVAGGVGVLRDGVDVQALDDTSVLWKSGEVTIRVTFDAHTRRIARMSYKSVGPAGQAELESVFDDYRDVGGGLMLPFQESLSQNGQSLGERQFVERKVNTGVAAAMFAKPN